MAPGVYKFNMKSYVLCTTELPLCSLKTLENVCRLLTKLFKHVEKLFLRTAVGV